MDGHDLRSGPTTGGPEPVALVTPASSAVQQALLDVLVEPAAVRSATGEYVAVNAAWRRLAGLEQSDVGALDGAPAWALDEGHGRALETGGATARVLVTGVTWHTRAVDVTWTAVELDGGMVTVAVAREVSDESDAQRWLETVVASTADGVISTRGEVTVSWNPAAEEILGYRAEDMVGCPLKSVKPSLAADADGWSRLIERVRLGETVRAEEMLWGHPSGEVRTVAVTATRIPADATGATGTSWVVRDVGREVERRQTLERLSMTDEETGLLNRRALTGALRSAEGAGAVLLADIDEFSGINDRVGHAGGDVVLWTLAARLRDVAPSDAVVARVGGDTFAIWCPGVTTEAAREQAERACGAVSSPIGADILEALPPSGTMRVRVSVGVAVTQGISPEKAMSDADIALAEAKSHKSGQVVVFDPEVHDGVRRRRLLLADVHTAVERGQLRILYQPVLRLDDGCVSHVEALVRWNHPELGDVSPTEFVPIAETSHAILTIGSWVLRTATRDAAKWQSSERLVGVGVAVNLSTRQLPEPGLDDQVRRALDEAGLPASLLVLEVTETALADDLDGAASALSRIRDLGCRVAIDDFGTGYSSLSYLHRIPATEIKIDRSITADITTDPDAVAIGDSVAQLAATLGLDVVAEGVETVAQQEVLRDLSVTHGQGWLYSRAVAAHELPALDISMWPHSHGERVSDVFRVPSLPEAAARAGARVIATYRVGTDRRITTWDADAERLTGFRTEEVVGRHCADGLLNHTDEEGRVLCGARCPLQATMLDGEPRTTHVFFRHSDGYRVPAVVKAQPVHDADGRIVGALETFTVDDTYRAALRRVEVTRRRGRDPLTGLPQRREALRWLEDVTVRHDLTAAVILVRLDSVPDEGEDGDVVEPVILAVSRTLLAVAAPSDRIARIGPGAFLLLLEADDRGHAQRRAQALRRHLSTTGVMAGRRNWDVALRVLALDTPEGRFDAMAALDGESSEEDRTA